MLREHNPSKCKVCKKEGSWALTMNTIKWFYEHDKTGIKIKLNKITGRIFDV